MYFDAAGNESVIIPIDHNMIQLHLQQQRIQNSNKTKDVDAMSLASSTHFTMVNGMGGPQRVTKDGLCSRGHQIRAHTDHEFGISDRNMWGCLYARM